MVRGSEGPRVRGSTPLVGEVYGGEGGMVEGSGRPAVFVSLLRIIFLLGLFCYFAMLLSCILGSREMER